MEFGSEADAVDDPHPVSEAMITTKPETKRHALGWWVLALALIVPWTSFLTPWAFLLQVGVIALASSRLRRHPSKAERGALIAAIVVIALSWVVLAIGGSALLGLRATFTGGSTAVLEL